MTVKVPSSFTGVSLLSQLPGLPSLPGTNPGRNPLDAFRLSIAAQIVDILSSVKLEDVYPCVQVPIKGTDFTVPTPRLKVAGMKPNEVAEKIVKEVSDTGV